MTRDEFAQAYAARSGVTVQQLMEWGREAAPCSCDEDGCEGWQMAYAAELRRRRDAGHSMLPRDQVILEYLDNVAKA